MLKTLLMKTNCYQWYNVKQRIAPVFPYLAYERFNLANVTDDECFAEFRFHKKDIPRLVKAFRLPPKFICRNGTTAFTDEGLCMLLRRLAYPCRYSDMIPRFGRNKPEICLIVHTVLRYSKEGRIWDLYIDRR